MKNTTNLLFARGARFPLPPSVEHLQGNFCSPLVSFEPIKCEHRCVYKLSLSMQSQLVTFPKSDTYNAYLPMSMDANVVYWAPKTVW